MLSSSMHNRTLPRESTDAGGTIPEPTDAGGTQLRESTDAGGTEQAPEPTDAGGSALATSMSSSLIACVCMFSYSNIYVIVIRAHSYIAAPPRVHRCGWQCLGQITYI